MTKEKFEDETKTLKKFFTTYCQNNHKYQKKFTFLLKYKNSKTDISTHLCKDCRDLLQYSFNKLQECPYEEKPRCRKCKNPCYEKNEWKKIAKIMRYNAINLGLIKIKKLFKPLNLSNI